MWIVYSVQCNWMYNSVTDTGQSLCSFALLISLRYVHYYVHVNFCVRNTNNRNTDVLIFHCKLEI